MQLTRPITDPPAPRTILALTIMFSVPALCDTVSRFTVPGRIEAPTMKGADPCGSITDESVFVQEDRDKAQEVAAMRNGSLKEETKYSRGARLRRYAIRG